MLSKTEWSSRKIEFTFQLRPAMTKPDLLKHVAQTGYNVGYGAKKHFATYDMAVKVPGFISLLTFIVGLYFLLVDFTAKKYFSAACLILGAVGIRISMW